MEINTCENTIEHKEQITLDSFMCLTTSYFITAHVIYISSLT